MECYGSRYREVPERLVDEKVATSGSTATAAHGSAVKIHCSASMWRAIPAAADFHSPAMAKGSAMAVTWQCYEGQRQYHDSTIWQRFRGKIRSCASLPQSRVSVVDEAETGVRYDGENIASTMRLMMRCDPHKIVFWGSPLRDDSRWPPMYVSICMNNHFCGTSHNIHFIVHTKQDLVDQTYM